MKKLLLLSSLVLAFITACNKTEEPKKRGLDYDQLKKELSLNADQVTKFDEIATKFKTIAEESKAATTGEGGKMDRVAFFSKLEEIYKQQGLEMAQLLNVDQMKIYENFMENNTRKRPRYNDELLAKIKTELAMNDEQAKVLEAANNAFEKEFMDAHDIYHGNEKLAMEYHEKFDAQRRNAIESVLNEDQITKFRELIKENK